MLPKPVFPLLAALGLALGACSDEPSEAAMVQAMNDFMFRMSRQEAALMKASGRQPKPMPVIEDFRKVGCASAHPEAGYRCEFEATVDGSRGGKANARFFKAADGTLTMVE
ncbi:MULTISPECIES: hypothetical protein [Methylorubrum]|uniref:hypothetical protein n=1 Tax=Methylorubrum TaxID=2282523 RepID=UPI00209DF44D|nr:hypothetical protein [Methylorubrum extorquens]MDF9863904.1 hypothetical protein [Methylorubrum pseudosasae]MDH6637498.1 hypothetical protein [Methylobacterium sp. SuP10 SLI 274]MDH6666677.1 hypothetical protein [Methylorubrum zatmanii]MCP1538188.1 hypothetical protein [Methylorubrum extorquens]MCP1558587.1 hypothetical protein [Methylorubrum extorquens]